MGLNIVATRKYDLADFAEGWEGAHVIVTVPNAKDRQEYVDSMSSMQSAMNAELEAIAVGDSPSMVLAKYDSIADEKVTEAARNLIRSGKVVSTNEEDNTSELVNFGKTDVDTVVDILGFAWKRDIVDIAMGNDRLKAKN